MKAQDEQSIRAKLRMVQQWRDSGQSKSDWAQAHGIDAQQLMGWITYAGRWQARLDGQPIAKRQYPPANKAGASTPSASAPVAPFAPVHLHMPAPSQPSDAHVRIEHTASGLLLHWPVNYTAQIAQLAQALRA